MEGCGGYVAPFNNIRKVKGMDEQQKMTAHQYLNQCRVMQMKIDRLKQKRQEYYDKATATTSHISPVKVQSSHNDQKMSEAIIDMVSLDEEIQNRIFELWSQQNKIMKEIQEIHALPYIEMLYKVYLQGKDPKAARKEINLQKFNTRTHVQYDKDFLYEDALDHFERCHPEIFAKDGEQSE